MREVKRPYSAQKALRVACLVLADLILINLSAFLALYIRFEFDFKLLCETTFLHDMLVYAGVNSACTIVIFHCLKLYNSLWEFASVPELLLSGEGMQKTKNDLIYIGHEIAFDPATFEENLMLLRAIPETDEPALRAKLREMVPTFHAPDGQTWSEKVTVG